MLEQATLHAHPSAPAFDCEAFGKDPLPYWLDALVCPATLLGMPGPSILGGGLRGVLPCIATDVLLLLTLCCFCVRCLRVGCPCGTCWAPGKGGAGGCAGGCSRLCDCLCGCFTGTSYARHNGARYEPIPQVDAAQQSAQLPVGTLGARIQ